MQGSFPWWSTSTSQLNRHRMMPDTTDITHIYVCGDSFAVGSGMPLDRCFEDSFGGVVASRLGLPLRVYARSGSCNFVIYLQVKKCVEMAKLRGENPLVLISLTSHSRLLMPYESRGLGGTVDLADVDYQSYHPYHHTSRPRRDLEFTPSPRPTLTSETISSIGLALHGNLSTGARFAEISRKKWKAIESYFSELYDDAAKMETDAALVASMHLMLERAGHRHVVLGKDRRTHPLVPEGRFVEIDWNGISLAHPDPARTMHCDSVGHAMVADRIIPNL